jgi:hypothetical protein
MNDDHLPRQARDRCKRTIIEGRERVVLFCREPLSEADGATLDLSEAYRCEKERLFDKKEPFPPRNSHLPRQARGMA